MSTKFRDEFVADRKKCFDMATEALRRARKSAGSTGRIMRGDQPISLDELNRDLVSLADAGHSAERSKIILFDKEQADVFLSMIMQSEFIPALDYRTPFENTWLQFSAPLEIPSPNELGNERVCALCLTQNELDRDGYRQVVNSVRRADVMYGHNSQIISADYSESTSVIFNSVRVVFSDLDSGAIVWNSQDETIFHSEHVSDTVLTWEDYIRRLASACIGYINCENVYLESVGGAPESVNRKREAKGKRRLEPYYVCRIRGVSYDKSDTSGTGSRHGIRYDVRGHFRRLADGKTIWVRAHQRGLANELYIPKIYKVDRQP